MTPDQHRQHATTLIRRLARNIGEEPAEMIAGHIIDVEGSTYRSSDLAAIAGLIRTATITVTWDDDPPAKPQLIGVPDDGYYLNGDDGYLWLTCNRCEDALVMADAGDELGDLIGAARSHETTYHPTTQEAQQ